LNELPFCDEAHVKKSVRLLLRESLSSEELSAVCNSYDVVGDIAVIRVPQILAPKRELIADAVVRVHSNVKTVLMQTSAVSGDFRIRSLEWVSGAKKTLAVHCEFGCVLEVDLAKAYFSPRLSFERKRIAGLVKPDETVVNMFAGVGCFSIIMARHSEVGKVFSVDLNPYAVGFMRKNVRLNRVHGKVIPLLGDSAVFVKERLRHVADRVLMPLPERACEYLDYALMALKPHGGWIHYYDFVHAAKSEEPVVKAKDKVTEKLNGLGVSYTIPFGRVVRATGPRWFQVVLDIFID